LAPRENQLLTSQETTETTEITETTGTTETTERVLREVVEETERSGKTENPENRENQGNRENPENNGNQGNPENREKMVERDRNKMTTSIRQMEIVGKAVVVKVQEVEEDPEQLEAVVAMTTDPTKDQDNTRLNQSSLPKTSQNSNHNLKLL